MLTTMVPNIPATVIAPGSPYSKASPYPYQYGGPANGLSGLHHLGFNTAAGTDEDARGFVDGVKLWVSPGTAFQTINHIAMGTEQAPILYTLGVALPPVLAVGLILALMSGGRRR